MVSSVVVRARWKPGRIQCFLEPRETLLPGGAAQSLLPLLGNGHHCQGCSGTALRGTCRACCAAWREGGGGDGCQQCRRGGRSAAAPWEVGAGGEEAKVSPLSTSQPPEIIVRLISSWNSYIPAAWLEVGSPILPPSLDRQCSSSHCPHNSTS